MIERKLRKLQERRRNSGWRIQHIPWRPEGKRAYYHPGNTNTWLFALAGFAEFFGGIPLLSNNTVSTPVGIGIMIAGLALLFSSRLASGYHLYRHYVRVNAKCRDRDVREFEDTESTAALPRALSGRPAYYANIAIRANDIG